MRCLGGLKPNGHIFVAALHACARAEDVKSGREVHADVLGSGIQHDACVCNCLVDMYAKCGELEEARRVFDSMATRDAITWNAMITGYAKCGQLEDARKLFDSLATSDAVTWNAMIYGYAEHGLGSQALASYARMEQEGLILADSFTFACLLKACVSAGALQQGRQLHSQIVERGLSLLEGDVALGSCLVNMYAKCGKVEDARKLFDSLATRKVVTWNAMINGYGTNNEGHKATSCFEEVMLDGVRPSNSTFTCLLVACSHAGLVSEARQYFDAMVKQHGHNPTAEHYVSMVDLLGRAGHLGEAEKVLKSAGCEKNSAGLMALLNACKNHGDIEQGTQCFESLVELNPQYAGAYVLMANMYADADRWAYVDRIEKLRKLAGANKKPAGAGFEGVGLIHRF